MLIKCSNETYFKPGKVIKTGVDASALFVMVMKPFEVRAPKALLLFCCK